MVQPVLKRPAINTTPALSTVVQDHARAINEMVPTVGIWTPALAGDVTPGVQTYSLQIGRYVKIGPLCFVSFKITLTAKDAATAGNMQITGLPFLSLNLLNLQHALTISSWASWDLNFGGGYTYIGARVTENSKLAVLLESGDNVVRAALTAADFSATSSLEGSGWYMVED